MRTVVVGERPPEIEDLIRRRRELGQDTFDEMWEGEYHVAPPGPNWPHAHTDEELTVILRPFARRAGLWGTGNCNIGTPTNYRVPDHAYFAERHGQLYNPTAEIVVEIVSPGDESRDKFDFYYGAGVKEALIVDPDPRTVEWYARGSAAFEPADRSTLLGITAAELTELIDWPD